MSHAVDIQPIWDASCRGDDGECHAPGGAWAIPDLSDDAYGDVVDVMAIQPLVNGANLAYVEPGEPDQSYVLLKIRGSHLEAKGSGQQMPCAAVTPDLACSGAAPGLGEEEVAMIERWIAGGAEP